jgi:hypothetical protein
VKELGFSILKHPRHARSMHWIDPMAIAEEKAASRAHRIGVLIWPVFVNGGTSESRETTNVL